MLYHKHGGKITAVKSIGHESFKKGVAEWFYVADVDWEDGSQSKGSKVYPILLCHDDTPESIAELNALGMRMNKYLVEHGEWLETPKHVGDYLVHWTPRKPAESIDL